jgi:hypothetical protein
MKRSLIEENWTLHREIQHLRSTIDNMHSNSNWASKRGSLVGNSTVGGNVEREDVDATTKDFSVDRSLIKSLGGTFGE